MPNGLLISAEDAVPSAVLSKIHSYVEKGGGYDELEAAKCIGSPV